MGRGASNCPTERVFQLTLELIAEVGLAKFRVAVVAWRCDISVSKESQGAGFLELSHARSSFLSGAADCHGAQLPSLVRFVEALQKKGALKPIQPSVLATTIWAMFTGFIGAGGAGSLALSREVLAAASACCWDAIRVWPTAQEPNELPAL